MVGQRVDGQSAHAGELAGAASGQVRGRGQLLGRLGVGAGAGEQAERVGAEVARRLVGRDRGRALGAEGEQLLGGRGEVSAGVQDDPGQVEVDAVEHVGQGGHAAGRSGRPSATAR